MMRGLRVGREERVGDNIGNCLWECSVGSCSGLRSITWGKSYGIVVSTIEPSKISFGSIFLRIHVSLTLLAAASSICNSCA